MSRVLRTVTRFFLRPSAAILGFFSAACETNVTEVASAPPQAMMKGGAFANAPFTPSLCGEGAGG